MSSSSTDTTTVRRLIDRQAEAYAGDCFLLSPETERVVTFGKLREHASAIARRLQQSGLQPGDKVAFLMDNGLFAAELFLGSMYGGFVSVPLNVRAGVSQLSYMVEHCDAKVVFVAQEYIPLMTEVMGHVQRPVQILAADVDEDVQGESDCPASQELAEPESEDPALLMYTSGSTGNPKAAVHTHRTILAGGRNSVAAHQLTEADRSLLVLPLYHINAECVTLIPTLMSGGSVVIPHKFSISHYWRWLDEHQCTWSAIVPTIVSQLLDWHDPLAESRGACFQRIRFLRSSSAPLAPSLHCEFLQKFPLLLIQAMGSSEGGNIFSNPLPPGENKIGSPGLPWGFEVKVVNREGVEVPPGEPGEILVRGEAMTREYYKEPGATAAAFDSEGWWHTGDLAYRDLDGYFFVVGRSKELIIKGGVNIAPRQIDDVLESHPAVLEAAAVGVPDRHMGEDVIAFVVPRASMECEERELLSFCESRLGHFKTPTRIQFVKDLPKGPSGKVQRLRLVEEAAQGRLNDTTSSSGFAPWLGGVAEERVVSPTLPTALEATIAGIWAEVLNVPEVETRNNFFALGGDSLLAIQCLSRIRDRIAIQLTLTDFFQNGTVAEQVGLIISRHAGEQVGDQSRVKATREEGTAVLPAIPRRGGALPYPLSPLQERLWFLEQLNPDLPIYNEAEAVRFHGKLNVGALEGALNAVIARHETLRSTIRTVGGVAMVVPLESYQLRLKRLDLSGVETAKRGPELERLLVTEPPLPFRLQDEPPIRATLIRLASDDHVIILMMHHLICDWSSLGVLWRELSEMYPSFCRGESRTLPALPIQHGDYAVWQRQQLTEASVAKDLAFWVEKLRGAPPLLELPSDRARPQMMSYRGARKRCRIPRTLTEALRQLSRQERKSLFAIFTTAWVALLYRYTGQEDISLGIPLAQRDQPELSTVIGFLLHTHVLRTAVNGEMTFRELAARVQQGALQLYEHRAVPFEEVVRSVQPERSLAYTPLFQVMVNWRDREQDLSFIGLEGLRAESLLAESRISKFDLTLQLTDMVEEVNAEIEYSTDLFDASTIERMFGHYERLLESIVADPEQVVGKLGMLTEAERAKILVEWNDNNEEFPSGKCIHELFEEQARRRPETIALVFGGQTLTYRELNSRADELAALLRALGVGPDVLVGLCVERSLDMVVGILGILKAGAAYLPIDSAYPADRISFVLEDSHAPVLVTQRPLLSSLPATSAQVVLLDEPLPALENRATLVPERPSASSLAYVLYTSGSTGKPKGVQIEHRAVVNFLSSMRRQPGLTSQDVLLAVTTLSFDIAGLELHLPLTTGARVVIASRDVAADGLALLRKIQTDGITMLQATPTTWRLILAAGWKGTPRLKALCGGEAMPADLASELLPRCTELWNMYGPTETTIWSTLCRVTDAADIHIGRPIGNTEAYILDPHNQPLPVGLPGELLIGGEGLARGYLYRPDLTAERFVGHPFKPGARLYRTGDLARYCANGNVDFLGRLDSQEKIRGHRIELGEIEAVMLQCAEVKSCAVVARSIHGDKRLIAYYVPRNLRSASRPDQLRDFLTQKLPAYMVPTVFSMLESLPSTPNGKIDRQALLSKDVVISEKQSAKVLDGPKSHVELRLQHIWQQVLGADNIGLHDNFFKLGGHSLLAVSLISKINSSLGTSLSIPSLFSSPTIEGIARIIEQTERRRSTQSLFCLRPAKSEGAIFFLGASVGMCRLAEHLDEGPAIFLVDTPIPPEMDHVLRDENAAKNLSLEEIVTPLVPIIEEQPFSGPCVFVGLCFGAAIAFELAHRIERDGGQVDMVVLLDAWRRWIDPTLSMRLQHLTVSRLRAAISWRISALRQATRSWGRLASASKPEAEARLLENPEDPQLFGLPFPLKIGPDGQFNAEAYRRAVEITRRLRNKYNWRPLEAHGLLIRPKEEHFTRFDTRDRSRGWAGLFKGGLEIEDALVSRGTLLGDDHVYAVSRMLQKHLATHLFRAA